MSTAQPEQGHGTTSCYQTQATTTTRWDRMVQPNSRRGRIRESHWKQCSDLPWLPKTEHHSAMKRTNSTDGKTTSKNSSTTLLHHSIRSSWPKLPVLPQTPQSSLPPTTADEITAAIRKLKKNRTPWICGITAELLKSGGAPIVSWLLPLFTLIWEYNLECHLHWLELRHNSPTVERKRLKIRRHQIPWYITSVCSGQGFRPRMSRTYEENDLCEASTATERLHPGRSTLDRIIALRLQAERRHEYRQPLYAAYINLRVAFNSLDRNSLWNILTTIGMPPKLVDIIKTLYSSTNSVFRVNGTISEAFFISAGVRQGCVLAANLLTPPQTESSTTLLKRWL